MNVEQLGRSNLGCEKAGTPREGLQPAEIPPIPPFRSAGKIVFWYVLIAGLWIFCTDKFVAAIGANPKAWNEMSTLKGLLFVLVTGSLLFVLIYRLVSRLRHARFSQLASEEKYRALIETTDTGYVILDSEGKVRGANQEYVQLTGHNTLAEIIGKSVLEWTAAHDRERNAAGIKKCLQQGFIKDLEIDYVKQAGQVTPVEINATVAKSGQGVQILTLCRDITERKLAEEALGQSERKYRLLFENLTVGFALHEMIYDEQRRPIDFRYLEVNPAFEKLTGVPASAVLGKTGREVNPAVEQDMIDAFGLVAQTGQPIAWQNFSDVEGRFYDAWIFSPIRDQFAAVFTDTTERRLAENAREKTSDRLKRINGCLLALGNDHDSNINRLTALCGELLGATCALYNRLQGDLLCSIGQWQTPPGFKSKDSAAGHICYDVLRDNRDDAVVITNLPQTSYAESDPNVRAYGLRTYLGCAVKCEGKAVGSLCVVYGTDYRPTDDDRRILGIIASAIGNEDTRKQAEAELNRLMTAIEQTPESVVITDTKGRILYVNPVFERVTGYSRAEVIGQNPRLLKSNRQDSAFYRELWAKISAGEVWRGRFINKKKDGALFTEDAVIAPVRDEKGTVTNYIAIKRDISHELELEVQYRQTQKIDSIGRLAGGVAHDFNNILAVICGHTDLALAQLSPDAPLRSNLECIQESAERAANLTRQLLAFARRQVIEPRRINLNELIVNLNKMLHRLIGEDIKLVTQAAPDLGQIKADPGQIEQVLLNLVVNARDAMPEGGTLTIHTDNVTLDEDYARRHLVTPGDYVMVSVSDTGVGMTDEVKQHIFEPFFTTKEQGKGTGLGLATCFGIIQQSNGHIHSDSQVDKGTQFKIYLPRVRGVEDSISSREVPVSLPQGTETILLAEDEPSLRQLMARVLRTQGYTVLEAADGHEALALAQANGAKIQLLLTDVIMPGLSGKTLAEWLGQVNPAVRVLFISGYINNNAVRDAMSRPGTFFLQKPFNPLNLAKKVREAIEAS
jgi:PAS domain S-box-containing protein